VAVIQLDVSLAFYVCVELQCLGSGRQQVIRVQALDASGQGEAHRGSPSMNHAQKYLAQANRQIAELTVQIARQRIVVTRAFDVGQRLEMAESLLDALEASLRIFEKHRVFLLTCSGLSSALPQD